jgi:hypothetical protein
VNGAALGIGERAGVLKDGAQHRLEVERRVDHLAHGGQRLSLLVEPTQILAHAVDAGGQCSQLIAIGDRHTLREVAGRDLTEADLYLGDRPYDRPRNRVA